MHRLDEKRILNIRVLQKKVLEVSDRKPVNSGRSDDFRRIDVLSVLRKPEHVTRPMKRQDLTFPVVQRVIDPNHAIGVEIGESRGIVLRKYSGTDGPEVDDLRHPSELGLFGGGECKMRGFFAVLARPAAGRAYADVGIA